MARGLRQFALRVPATFPDSLKRVAGETAIREIQRKTRSGRDIDGSSFAPYSAGYREYKRRIGQSTTPNLQLTGEMLNTMRVLEIRETSVIIGYTPGSFSSNKAAYNQDGNNGPSRQFLGVTDRQETVINNRIEEGSPEIAAQRFLEENPNPLEDFFDGITFTQLNDFDGQDLEDEL